ncbi:Battenin [Dactylella cylindrospora]|nr:Battenin [Dactylella cylindrospora]
MSSPRARSPEFTLPMPGSPASSWAVYKSRFSSFLKHIRGKFADANPRVCAAFWLFGLINNVLYVIILSAALDLVGPTVPKGIVLLFDIMPAFITKLTAPYFIHLIPYWVRIVAFFSLSTCGMVVIAFGDSIPWRMFGIAISSLSSGAGEMTFVSMTHFYDQFALAMWSSGTGGAGIVGGTLYLALSTWFGLSTQTSLMVTSFLPILMLVSYFGVLPRDTLPESEREIRRGAYSRVDDEDEEEQGLMEDNEIMNGSVHSSGSATFSVIKSDSGIGASLRSFRAKLKKAKGLFFPYILPLLMVYISEYTINIGVAPTLLYPLEEMPFKNYRDAYPTYNTIYQVGVFISRSSTPFIRVRHLYPPSILQFINLAVLTAHAMGNFIPSIWIIFLIIFWEGILGGLVYVNTFAEITDNVPHEDREFSLAATTILDFSKIRNVSIKPVNDEALRSRVDATLWDPQAKKCGPKR